MTFSARNTNWLKDSLPDPVFCFLSKIDNKPNYPNITVKHLYYLISLTTTTITKCFLGPLSMVQYLLCSLINRPQTAEKIRYTYSAVGDLSRSSRLRMIAIKAIKSKKAFKKMK